MCADRSGSGYQAQPGWWSPVRWKGILREEHPQSSDRERFPRATDAIVLRLLENFSASGLRVEARRRSKPSKTSAKVLPAERRRKMQGNALEGPRKCLRPAWTARLRNRT